MSLNNKLYGKGSLAIPNITDESGVEGVKAINLYKQRILTILSKDDYAIMPENTKKYNKILSEIYKDLNLPFIDLNNIIYVDYNGSLTSSILDAHKEIILDKSIKKLFPFINSNKIDSIGKIFNLEVSRDSLASETINDKGIAQSELHNLGVATPEGKIVYSEKQAEEFFEELKRKGYETVTFKLRRTASGMGVYKIKDQDELQKKMFEHKNQLKEGILLDGWIEGNFISSPNIQYNIGKTPKDDVFIGCSSQILSDDGTVHLGNISNEEILNDKKLQEDLEIIRNWIRSKKAYGIVGIDFAIFEDKNTKKQKAYFMEINGRINGSTHGAVIASKIYGEDFQDKWSVMNNICLPNEMSINDFITSLQKDGIYYDPSKKQGVIPTNISAIDKYKKAMVIIVGNKGYMKEVLKTLQTYKQ